MGAGAGVGVGVGLALLLLVGCGQEPASPDVVASASASAANEETGSAGRDLPGDDYVVPVPTAPRDSAGLLAEPCSSLSSTDAAALQVGTGTVAGDGSCQWEQDGAGLELVVGARSTGLDDFYAGYRTDGDGGWQRLQVDGLPAAYANGPFEASAGACVLLVALDAATHLRVESTGADTAAACERATSAAGLVVAGLPAAG